MYLQHNLSILVYNGLYNAEMQKKRLKRQENLALYGQNSKVTFKKCYLSTFLEQIVIFSFKTQIETNTAHFHFLLAHLMAINTEIQLQ